MRKIFPHNFFGVPNRAGWLTIANCAFFAAGFFGLLGQPDIKDWGGVLLMAAFITFSVPVAIFELLPQLDYHPSLPDVVEKAIIVGLNAVIWGYGLSYLIDKVAAWYRRHSGDTFFR